MNNSLQINVLTSEACKKRISVIKNTWGQHFSDIVYYADFEEGTNIIKCTSNPTATGNEQKLLNRLKQIKQNNKHDWYFFVDDDTFINANNFLAFLKTAENTKTYGRVIGGWGIKYFQGGGGVLISSNLITSIPDRVLYLRGSTFSDVLFGQIMKDANIELIHIEQFYDRSPESYKLNEDEIKKAITFHQVANTMTDLYKEIY